jgi:iron complex outermembrane receptor protein
LVNYYKNPANKPKFQAIGMSAQDLFDGYTTEESDTFDIGVRYWGDFVEISPTLFMGKHKNLLVGVINPLDPSLRYQQNIGKATSYGLETEVNIFVNDTTTLFFNPTYTDFTYDNNIQGSLTKGNQVVDVPKWMGNAGLIYKFGAFELVPTLRYLGERYGNATNTEKVDDAWIADFKATYTKKNFYDKAALTVSLDIYNLFDKEYISIINASDDTLADIGTAYYQGSPRSVMLSFGITY